MSGYRYRARTADGQVRVGIMQAASPDEVMRTLARSKLIPEWVRPAPKHRSFRLHLRPSTQELAAFTRQLATLVDAGVPLVQSLHVLEDLTENRQLKKAIGRTHDGLHRGMGLADAMRQHPNVFSDIYVNMVEAGEEGGMLDSVLGRLADYLERSHELQSRMKTALIYPSVIVGVAVTAAVVMLTYVVPTFQEIFAASGLELPYPTLMLVQTSDLVREQWAFLLAGALALVLVLQQLHELGPVRTGLDALILRLPVLGDLIQKVAIARFCHTASSLLTAGVKLLDAFESAARTTGNAVIERAIIRSREAIAAGQGVSGPLMATGLMTKLVEQMTRVGEETGRLDAMLAKVAAFYDAEVETAVDRMTKLLEPTLVVVVGFMLGGIVIAMYLPIFETLTTAM